MVVIVGGKRESLRGGIRLEINIESHKKTFIQKLTRCKNLDANWHVEKILIRNLTPSEINDSKSDML